MTNKEFEERMKKSREIISQMETDTPFKQHLYVEACKSLMYMEILRDQFTDEPQGPMQPN